MPQLFDNFSHFVSLELEQMTLTLQQLLAVRRSLLFACFIECNRVQTGVTHMKNYISSLTPPIVLLRASGFGPIQEQRLLKGF